MKEQQRGILRLATLVALPILLGGASCNNDSDDSDVVRAAASCATSPSGGTIHIAQGAPFRIILAGSVPCTGGGGVVVICGSASFRATVNQSRFFSAGTLNEWSVGPSLGVQRDLALSTSTWLGSDDVLIEVTPNQTGSDVLARCDFDHCPASCSGIVFPGSGSRWFDLQLLFYDSVDATVGRQYVSGLRLFVDASRRSELLRIEISRQYDPVGAGRNDVHNAASGSGSYLGIQFTPHRYTRRQRTFLFILLGEHRGLYRYGQVAPLGRLVRARRVSSVVLEPTHLLGGK